MWTTLVVQWLRLLFRCGFDAFLVAQTVKRLPAMWETWVRFLGLEDPLEKEMAIHSSTLAGKIPWMEEPDRLQSMGSQRVGHDWATSLDTDNFWVEAGCFLQSQSAFHHPDSCFSNISSWFMVTKNENLCCSASSPLSDTLVVILSCHLNATLGLTRTAFYKVDN